MKVSIVAIGQRMPAWAQAAYADYAKRMPAEWHFACKALKATPRDTGNTEQVKSSEATRIEEALAGLGRQCYTVVLDERGKAVSTHGLADLLRARQAEGQDVAFVIGGADGLHERVKAGADVMLKLSDLTLPHALVRVLLAEQLYRAWSVLANHPYHRE